MLELNEYLFHAFGVEGDEGSVSATWPFTFQSVGEVAGRSTFAFEADGQPYFAYVGPTMGFLRAAGMSPSDLALQWAGSDWIGARSPVTLKESRPGDASVPSLLERTDRLRRSASAALGVADPEVLEGLFLRATGGTLGLARAPGAEMAVVVGLDRRVEVGFPRCSAWRRLAWGVGWWLA